MHCHNRHLRGEDGRLQERSQGKEAPLHQTKLMSEADDPAPAYAAHEHATHQGLLWVGHTGRSSEGLTPELSGHINREAIDWSA